MRDTTGRYVFVLRVSLETKGGWMSAKVRITSPTFLPLYRQLLLAKSVAEYGAGIEAQTTVTEWSGSDRPALGTFRVVL